jgi:predicted CoA-binding protein
MGIAMSSDYDRILRECRTIAVVGCSADPSKASNQVASYLRAHGYRIRPVNPHATSVLGERCYPNLDAIPEKVDIVQIFRRSEDVPSVVDEAMKIGPRVIWMQLGVRNEEAARRAEDAGIEVVMDRCLKMEHQQLGY